MHDVFIAVIRSDSAHNNTEFFKAYFTVLVCDNYLVCNYMIQTVDCTTLPQTLPLHAFTKPDALILTSQGSVGPIRLWAHTGDNCLPYNADKCALLTK